MSRVMRNVLKAIVPGRVRELLRQTLGLVGHSSSLRIMGEGYQVLEGTIPIEPNVGWQNSEVAKRQYAAFTPVVQQMRAGKLRRDFSALIEALNRTEMKNPVVVEVGCGSAWNREVLERSSVPSIRYVGLDYGIDMVRTARASYPSVAVIVGDAFGLPFRDRSIDVLVSGTVLMHLVSYQKAIQESCRVSRRWCIFHTVPLLRDRKTTVLQKDAYGQPTLEVIFNEGELLALFASTGLVVREAIDSLSYDLQAVLGEPTVTKTFVCEVMG